MVPDGIDHLRAPLRLNPEPLSRPPAPARGRGRGPGQLVTRSVAVDEEAADRSPLLVIDLATEVPTGTDLVVVVERTDHAGTLAEETHLLPKMLALPMPADPYRRHPKGADTRIR